jgi:hypothetical protein
MSCIYIYIYIHDISRLRVKRLNYRNRKGWRTKEERTTHSEGQQLKEEKDKKIYKEKTQDKRREIAKDEREKERVRGKETRMMQTQK